MKTFLVIYTFFLGSGETVVAIDDNLVLAQEQFQCQQVADVQAEKFRREWQKGNDHFFQAVIVSCEQVDE